jgi:ABC-type oligopeptide transport system substrate-binding subunit
MTYYRILILSLLCTLALSCSKKTKTEPKTDGDVIDGFDSTKAHVEASNRKVTDTFNGIYLYGNKTNPGLELYITRDGRGKIYLRGNEEVVKSPGKQAEKIDYEWKTNAYFEQISWAELYGISMKLKDDSIFVRWFYIEEVAAKNLSPTKTYEETFAKFTGHKVK